MQDSYKKVYSLVELSKEINVSLQSITFRAIALGYREQAQGEYLVKDVAVKVAKTFETLNPTAWMFGRPKYYERFQNCLKTFPPTEEIEEPVKRTIHMRLSAIGNIPHSEKRNPNYIAEKEPDDKLHTYASDAKGNKEVELRSRTSTVAYSERLLAEEHFWEDFDGWSSETSQWVQPEE